MGFFYGHAENIICTNNSSGIRIQPGLKITNFFNHKILNMLKNNPKTFHI
jgi:hypothetical protein